MDAHVRPGGSPLSRDIGREAAALQLVRFPPRAHGQCDVYAFSPLSGRCTCRRRSAPADRNQPTDPTLRRWPTPYVSGYPQESWLSPCRPLPRGSSGATRSTTRLPSGGMATVHFGRLLGPVGFSRTVAIKRLHAQFAHGPGVRRDVPRRGAPRGAHPPPERRRDARRRRDGGRALPRHGVRAGRVALHACIRPLRKQRRARAAAHRRRDHRRRAPRPPRRARSARTSAASRSASSTATSRRRTSSSAPTASRASSTSASPRPPGACRRRATGSSRASSRTWRPSSSRRSLTRRRTSTRRRVVLWEALTGKRLFARRRRGRASSRASSTPTVAHAERARAGLPRAFDRVVFARPRTRPGERYATAREMAIALDAVIGVASPTEIGEWVEQTAAEELRGRAALIADIERTASENIEIPPLGSPPADAHAKRPREIPSAWHQTTKREGLPVTPRDASQVSSLSLARGSEPPNRPSRKLVSGVVVVAVASGVAVLLLAGAILVVQARKASSDAQLARVPSGSATAAATRPAASGANAGGDNANANARHEPKQAASVSMLLAESQPTWRTCRGSPAHRPTLRRLRPWTPICRPYGPRLQRVHGAPVHRAALAPAFTMPRPAGPPQRCLRGAQQRLVSAPRPVLARAAPPARLQARADRPRRPARRATANVTRHTRQTPRATFTSNPIACRGSRVRFPGIRRQGVRIVIIRQ